MNTPPPFPFPPRRQGVVQGFFEGFSAPGEGFTYLKQHPELWKYAYAPIVINIVITLVLLIALIFGGYYLLSWMHHLPYFAGGVWGRIQEFFAVILTIVALLALLWGAYMLFGSLLSATFNERLAKQVELQLGTPTETLREASLMYQVGDSFYDFGVITLSAALSFVIGCIPVVGVIVGPIFNFYVDFWVYGYDFLDIPMTLRRIPRAEKLAFARRHRPQVLGFGAMVTLLNLLPVFGSVLLASASVGAVLLHKRLRDRDAMVTASTIRR